MGMNKNVNDMDLSNPPSPNNRMNRPLNIGFLTHAYGPVATSSCGGLNGTGVPFTLIKWNIDSSTRNAPKATTGRDTQRYSDKGRN